MEFAQLTQDGQFDKFITETGNIKWDANHLCPVKALTAEECVQFRIIKPIMTDSPVFNPLTQVCDVDGCELVNGKWQIKWSITNLTASEIEQKQLEAEQQLIANVTAAVQNKLDTEARTRNYDGILSACTYATSTNLKFKAEADACVAWRDAVWDKCYDILTDVKNNVIPVPTAEEVIAQLPQIVWPS